MSGAHTTVIRDADWVIAWDADSQGHRYLRRADLAFRGGRITHVGQGYGGPAEEEIDGRGLKRFLQAMRSIDKLERGNLAPISNRSDTDG